MVMSTLDKHPDVIQWNSEEITIPYKSPVDNKIHRYFPDFWVKKKNHSDGKIVEVLIEVKPYAQTKPPKPQTGKPSRKYLNEVYTWGVNDAKWKAARNYCADRRWEFQIITEKELGLDF